MLIAVCSLGGSPGVTTLSVALAACLPQPIQPVLVECDPSGGSLAVRFGLNSSPGLVSLTAAARRDPTAELLWEHTQSLPGGLPVVAAPPGADYTRAALATLVDSHRRSVSVLRGAATRPASLVIADCGRLDTGSPAVAIARDADRVLLLTHSRADELARVAAGLSMVDLWAMRPGLLLVGPGYSPAEVTHELGVPVVAQIPRDDKGARALTGIAGPHRGPARSSLGRAAHTVATALLVPRSGHLVGASDHASSAEAPVTHLASQHDTWPPLAADGPSRNGTRLEDLR
jgi:hypothetical protein